MIINGLGIAEITDDRELIIKPSPMNWRIESSDNQSAQGEVNKNAYNEVVPPGTPPWTVTMGIGNFSQSGQASGINSADAVVSGLVVFPKGPNGDQVLVNTKEE